MVPVLGIMTRPTRRAPITRAAPLAVPLLHNVPLQHTSTCPTPQPGFSLVWRNERLTLPVACHGTL